MYRDVIKTGISATDIADAQAMCGRMQAMPPQQPHPPYDDIYAAMVAIESAIDWLDNQPGSAWARTENKHLRRANHELRNAYFTMPYDKL